MITGAFITLQSLFLCSLTYTPDSNTFVPVKIFNGDRISINESGVRHLIADTTPFIIDGYHVYFDTVADVVRIFQFKPNSTTIKIESLLHGNIRHGFYYKKKGRTQVICLYDRGAIICKAIIKNGKMRLEYIANGNIKAKRLYSSTGQIKFETIKYDNCSESASFKKVNGKLQYNEQTFSPYFIRDIANTYTYLNYPPLKWLKSFAGIDLDIPLH